MEATRWRAIVLWSLLATVLAGGVVLVALARGGQPVLTLINSGERGPSAAALREDYPGVRLPEGGGHDGQQFYAVARTPLDPEAAAPHLDRPQYRLQRIAYPLLAGLLHPGRGGDGLVLAMFAIGGAAMFMGGVATGALATARGAPPWSAALFAAIPGNLAALRISTADTLALAAAVAAVALCERRKLWPAVGFGVLAVLSKESMLVVLAAYALYRRDRRGLLVAGVSGAAAAWWWAWLRLTVDVSSPQVVEFTAPFAGIARAATHWARGEETTAALIVLLTAALAVGALLRRRDRFTWSMVGVTAAFVTVLSADATGLWANASRVMAPTLLFAVVALITRAERAAAIAAAPGAERDPAFR